MGALWVAKIHISARVEEKINSKHQITADEVRAAVECVEGLDYKYSFHEVRGWRWLVKTRIRGRPVMVVLYEAADPLGDIYRLGGAHFTDG
ncbi:hypothetical protein [Actinoplanes sp. RD1]|uniref:hypothetical protein n=1 Tax=Actinoplanes sp. RD1 TaxID=3064538 RepID=UPI002740940E|nr:hypothetical protein [Actinoplanes sp. RD1]